MDKVINLGTALIAEQIFASLDTETLMQYQDVSQTWKVIIEGILIKRKDSFLMACKLGNLKIVKLILEHYSDKEDRVNATDDNGWTPLMWACLKRHNHIVKFLLNHSDLKIDFDAENNDKVTAYTLACSRGYKDITKLLRDRNRSCWNIPPLVFCF